MSVCRADEHVIDLEEHDDSDAASGSEAGEAPEHRTEEPGEAAADAHSEHAPLTASEAQHNLAEGQERRG